MTRRTARLLPLPILLIFVFQPVMAMSPSDGTHAPALSFAERVEGREAVEDVLWSHRIWPEVNPTPKPARHQFKGRDQIVAEVEESLLYEAVLDQVWNEALTVERVQRELDRIAHSTRRPEILLEIFAALDNDPLLVAECFVRPQLARRLVRRNFDLEVTPSTLFPRPNRDFSSWFADVRRNLVSKVPETGSYTLPGVVKCRFCNDDNWSFTPELPSFELTNRRDHTIVWTGTEVIVWGGSEFTDVYTSTGGRYDPVADVWTPTTTVDAPSARANHVAVWTGTEMIVWGGWDGAFMTGGGRYDPVTDTWNSTSEVAEPSGCYEHSAVWTGTEMIVWGGTDNTYNKTATGARYDPSTDSWTATATAGAPAARSKHQAIWTGSVMIIWGGQDSTYNETDTGGRYDPATDTWTETSTVGPPSTRSGESAVWTGTEMIIWGGVSGVYTNTGGRYNPTTDSWTGTSVTGAPTGRQNHTAVWTGAEMIIWGGNDQNTGGRYDPSTDSWSATTTVGAPTGRSLHEAVWTGAEMIVWGKYQGPGEQGKRYDPATDSWTAMWVLTAPEGRGRHTAVWLGTEMIIWGGSNTSGSLDDGYIYGLLTDSWTSISSIGAPSARSSHRAVWTGTEMIIVGGAADNSGGRYNPATDTWVPTSTVGAPANAYWPAAVWTGTEVLVWGGNYVNTGGKYNPATDTWTPTSTLNAPPGLTGFAYAWADGILVVWGGQIPGQPGGTYANWGGRYNPTADMWFATSTVGAPSARVGAQAVWTGTEMIIWGGYTAQVPDLYPTSGGRYDPYTDSWVAMGDTGAPSGRYFHTLQWTGEEMVVWGGENNDGVMKTGGRYDPDTGFWMTTKTVGAPRARNFPVSVWTGSEVLLWGGDGSPREGGIYCASGVSDYVPPTDPSITGAVPVPGVWTSDDTILVFWSGSTDADSGVAGYSVLMDHSPSSTPDDTVEVLHTADPHSIEMPAVATGDDWYFHVKACDHSGLCSAGIHFGPYWIDTIAPSSPGAVTSSSHDGGAPVSDATIDVAWGASTDADSDLSGYRYDFTQSLTPPACSTLYETTGGITATSWSLADGTWYLHVCAEDVAGNGSDVTTGGPYIIDTTAPANPSSLASTSHNAGVWSQSAVVDVQWSGAADAIGVDGYSVLFDTSAVSQPDTTVDVAHTTDPHGTVSGTLPDGDSHYFHLSTCDQAGNCSTAAHTGPYLIDGTAPSAPGAVTSPSHGGGSTGDATIDVAWGAAIDATALIDGYSYAFNANPTWVCETTKDVEEGTTSVASPPLATGTWFVHVCAVDNAGNWGPVTSGGPYVVDGVVPTVLEVASVADSGDGVLTGGETIDAPVTRLLLAFSEDMLDPAGHSTPGDVTNPASYLLVGDGGDGTVSTTGCSVDPSDVAVTIAEVDYDEVTSTSNLGFDGGSAVPVGSYALFACSSVGLGDVAGNALDGDGDGVGGDDFGIAFDVAESSLLLNPNIDGDMASWSFSGPVTTTVAVGPDSDGLAWSGSLHLTGTAFAGDVAAIEQCLAPPPAAVLHAGGLVRVASILPGSPRIEVALTTYDSTGCVAGDELSIGRSHNLAGDTAGSWAALPQTVVSSESPQSVKVSLVVRADQALTLDVAFDILRMWTDDETIFVEGYEVGDTRNWSFSLGGL